MKRKIISVLLSAVMMTALLAGCGGQSGSSSSGSAAPAASAAASEAPAGSSEKAASEVAEAAAASTEAAGEAASTGAESTEAAPDAGSGEAIVIGTTYIVDTIDPTNSGDPWSLTADGISETLFKQNEKGELVSHLAEGIEKKDDKTWILTLKPDMKFSDGSAVDAAAVADCINDIMANNEMATASAGVIKATAGDDVTVELATERTTTVMASVLCEWTNVVYKKADDGSFVFTGPFMLKNLNPGVQMDLTPNPYYDENASKRPDVTLMAFADGATMQQAFSAGEIDMAFTVTPETAIALEGEGHTVKNMDAGYQYFTIVNMAKDPLSDLKVRQAINLALNREDTITALKGGRVATGFFAQYYDFAGEVEEKTDEEEAKKLLKDAGYEDSDGDGLVDKDGKNLTLKLTTYPSRPDLSILMQLAADELNSIGIDVSTEVVDNIDEVLGKGEFDLAFYAQHTAPTGEPGYALNQFFRTGEGKNNVGYSNKEVDALLDEMGTLEAGSERNELAKQVQAHVAEDLPVIFLVDPQWNIAVSEKLQNYQPYCGDYYVVNDQLGL
ncbi:MAG: ABC transporter substrate-binding protein [Lachnospiraceae bacterium]|nr:ABC transporter substrate-binding protein [Lachnospiraceae bacterium]